MTAFFFCALMLAAQIWGVRLILTESQGILPVYTLTDMKALIICTVVILMTAIADSGFTPMFLANSMLICWNAIQIIRLNHITSRSVQTTAVLKDYQPQVMKIYYSEEHKGFNHNDYSFYAPVMCYETDSGEKESVSRIFTQNFKWEKETEYPICYSAVNPEVFWFPEQKAKLTLPYLVGLCISAVILVGLLAFYFAI
ncbi:MAG: hypothetical protein IJ644_02825 [Oscillospiraceae bacterium]|nr:hypothetical protein [Oscillospiraceae bacterium]